MTLTLDWTNIGDFVLRSRIINVLTRGIKFRCLIINLNIFRRLVHKFMNGRGILWQIATFKTKLCDREAGQRKYTSALENASHSHESVKEQFFQRRKPFYFIGAWKVTSGGGGGRRNRFWFSLSSSSFGKSLMYVQLRSRLTLWMKQITFSHSLLARSRM